MTFEGTWNDYEDLAREDLLTVLASLAVFSSVDLAIQLSAGGGAVPCV